MVVKTRGEGENLVLGLIGRHGDADLVEVALALHPPRRFPRGLDRRKRQPDKDADDRDDDQEFDERKGPSPPATKTVRFHGRSSPLIQFFNRRALPRRTTLYYHTSWQKARVKEKGGRGRGEPEALASGLEGVRAEGSRNSGWGSPGCVRGVWPHQPGGASAPRRACRPHFRSQWA